MPRDKLVYWYKKFRQSLVLRLLVPVLVVLLVVYIFRHMHLGQDISRLENANVGFLILVFLGMGLSLFVRAVSWRIILRQAYRQVIPLNSVFNAICVGVFLSATSPLRLGEVARALVISRHLKGSIKSIPRIAGTIVCQTLMNILALAILGLSLATVASTRFDFRAIRNSLLITLLLIVIAGISIIIAYQQKKLQFVKDGARHFIVGFRVFKSPLPAAYATLMQLLAWALQALACYLLLVSLHIHATNNIYAAGAVLFAVNVTAVIPITPSNVGTFQAACVAVLSGLFGVSSTSAITYGIALQLVEVITAIALGAHALNIEGLSRKTLLAESRNTKL